MSGYRRCCTLGILNGFSFRENESTRRAFHLLSLEHQELVGAGFCTPDFVLATGELPRGHIGSRSGRARISPSGVEARPRSRPSRCPTPISLIDTDGVRLGRSPGRCRCAQLLVSSGGCAKCGANWRRTPVRRKRSSGDAASAGHHSACSPRRPDVNPCEWPHLRQRAGIADRQDPLPCCRSCTRAKAGARSGFATGFSCSMLGRSSSW